MNVRRPELAFLTSLFRPIMGALIALIFGTNLCLSQGFVDEGRFVSQLDVSGGLPENLLKAKAVVLHSFTVSERDLTMIQEYFQKTGIDAVAYYPADMVTAGKDVSKAFAEQLVKREIAFIVVVRKVETEFKIWITPFNGKENIVEPNQKAWHVSNVKLEDALKGLMRSCSMQLKRTNLLVNDTPETGTPLDPIIGKRNEFFAVDMKVDLVAVPKFGDAVLDAELEKLLTENFPFKFKMTEPGTPEKELRKQGMLYVLCFVHTRAKIAKELLGYTPGKSETAIVSVTYPGGQPVLRNIPANTSIFKVYFKHIDSGNIFLGNKWDADVTWQAALMNNIRGMKTELRLD